LDLVFFGITTGGLIAPTLGPDLVFSQPNLGRAFLPSDPPSSDFGVTSQP
jgi:hypothetical protein